MCLASPYGITRLVAKAIHRNWQFADLFNNEGDAVAKKTLVASGYESLMRDWFSKPLPDIRKFVLEDLKLPGKSIAEGFNQLPVTTAPARQSVPGKLPDKKGKGKKGEGKGKKGKGKGKDKSKGKSVSFEAPSVPARRALSSCVYVADTHQHQTGSIGAEQSD